MPELLFLVTRPQLKDYSEFFRTVLSDQSCPGNSLAILVISEIKDTSQLNLALSSLYAQGRKVLMDSGYPPDFAIDVYVDRSSGNVQDGDWNVFHVAEEPVPSFFSKSSLTAVKVSVPHTEGPDKHDDSSSSFSCVKLASLPTSAVGGTFDHLHDAHKILLQMAVFCASKLVIVGVTGQKLLVNKKYASELQSLDLRINNTVLYLQKILRTGQAFRIFQINDVCGPTGYIADINALVISEETMEGATFVNSIRRQNGFSPLKILCVKVIGGRACSENGWVGKLSSTDLRKYQYEKTHKHAST